MIENTKNVLPIHLTGMENIKGQQAINSILDSMNSEIDNHKWVITTQDYTNLRFEKYLESGSTLTVDQKPKTNIPIVGTHNNRKVYIGNLDVQGNLIVSNLALRDNVTQVAKSWEVRSSSSAQGSFTGTYWDSESFRVGIRDPLPLSEVKSIPNDIGDSVYGSTIYNKETSTVYGTSLDTKTFEKKEVSYYIVYPTWEETSRGETVKHYALDDWIKKGRINIGSQTYFPQITTSNAKACWAPNQPYGVFTWENSGYLTFHSYSTFTTYEDFYNFVSQYPSTQGKTGKGVMIPSYSYVNNSIKSGCTMYGTPITTRRFISEEFDKRNSGIVKVDISYRV